MTDNNNKTTIYENQNYRVDVVEAETELDGLIDQHNLNSFHKRYYNVVNTEHEVIELSTIRMAEAMTNCEMFNEYVVNERWLQFRSTEDLLEAGGLEDDNDIIPH